MLGVIVFFFKVTGTTEIYTYSHTLSLHDALPILKCGGEPRRRTERVEQFQHRHRVRLGLFVAHRGAAVDVVAAQRIAQFGGQEDHAAILPCSASCASRWRDSSQSAALVAALAARKIARLSSRNTSSHDAR